MDQEKKENMEHEKPEKVGKLTTPDNSEESVAKIETPVDKAELERRERQERKEKLEKAKSLLFDREFNLLIKRSREVIETRYCSLLSLGQTRAELVTLNRYQSIYKNMTPQEHYVYFDTIYNRNRNSILNTIADDRWLRNEGIVVQFGEGIRDLPESYRQIRIMLSDIYKIACELQSKAEKSLDGIDEKFAAEVGQDLILPDIMLLHLTRIFCILNTSSDKEKLSKIVGHFEDRLAVPVVNRLAAMENVNNTVAPAQGPVGGGLSGLFSLATSVMEKIGIKPPAGMKHPTEEEVITAISAVFNHETTQNALQSVVSTFQGNQDIGAAVQSVVKNIADPATLNTIKDSVIQTAQEARNTNSTRSQESTKFST